MPPIDRRHFLQTGVAGSVAIAAARIAGAGAGAAEAASRAVDVQPFGLEEATLADLQKKMQTGGESARNRSSRSTGAASKRSTSRGRRFTR